MKSARGLAQSKGAVELCVAARHVRIRNGFIRSPILRLRHAQESLGAEADRELEFHSADQVRLVMRSTAGWTRKRTCTVLVLP